MAIIVEDGTSITGANAYASVEYGDAYAAAHLYASAWTAANTSRKEAALQMASRMIDAGMQWAGARKTVEQGLDWPRYAVERNDIQEYGFAQISQPLVTPYYGRYYDESSVPTKVKDATCEYAISLLSENRSADADGKGIQEIGLGQSAIKVVFDKKDTRRLLPDLVGMMLEPFGTKRGAGRNMVAVRRVQ